MPVRCEHGWGIMERLFPLFIALGACVVLAWGEESLRLCVPTSEFSEGSGGAGFMQGAG